MDTAAQMLVYGLDPLRYLSTRDSFTRSMYEELAKRAAKVKDQLDDNLAAKIANNVGKLFSK